MSRVRPQFVLFVTLFACNSPGLKDFTSGPYGHESGGSSGSSSGDSSSSGSTGTSTGTGSGTDSVSGDTSTTGDTTGDTTGTTSSSTGEPASSTGSSGPTSVCGDGVVDGEEECDDTNLVDDDRCANDCRKNRWIFASAANDHTGDLGGIDGADSLCRQYALKSPKTADSWQTFIAWLSDSDHDVRDRLYPGKGRYVRTDNVVVVGSIEQLYSGMLDAPIELDEHGQPAPGIAVTGTEPDGTAAPGTHCQNWTSKSGLEFSAYIGATAATDAWWTLGQDPNVNPTSCIGGFRLYCIEGE